MTYPSLNGTDVCGRSGHATGTNLDAYDDKSFIVRGIRGVKALAHYSNVDANIKVPRFECLGAHVTGTVDALLKELFLVSVPVFLLMKCLYQMLLQPRFEMQQGRLQFPMLAFLECRLKYFCFSGRAKA